MNRQQRRHPSKGTEPKTPPDQQLKGPERPPQEANPRAKSARHKKVTADKWNQ
jgi:hypothetical protein